MRVKRDHLRKRGKITLSIPSQDISFVESLVERFPNISFSELVLIPLLKQKGLKHNQGRIRRTAKTGVIELAEFLLQGFPVNQPIYLQQAKHQKYFQNMK